jgi:hypothetical protein
MASQASRNDSIGKEVFLRRPSQPFDSDFEGDVSSRSHDTDEDWLPDVKDIIRGNFYVMIDMTGDSDSEVCHHLHTTGIITGINFSGVQDDAKSSSRYPRSDTGTHPTIADPTRPQSSPYGKRPPWACQPPKAVDSIDSE